MIKNYFTLTFRNLRKDKWFSLINITGLTIGITSSLIIFIYISQELSFDNFHENTDKLYRVARSTTTASGSDYEASVPYPLIKALKEDFTQFAASTLVHVDERPLATIGEDKFMLDQVVFADSNFFDTFSYRLLSGNPAKLGEPNFAFITQATAHRLFNDDDPIGKKIELRNKIEVEVAGMLEDTPPNSHLQFDLLVSYPTFSSEYFGLKIDTWQLSAEGYAYVVLKPNVQPEAVEEQLTKTLQKYYANNNSRKRTYYLQPVQDIHFNATWNREATNTTTLWALGIIGAFILVIGCVNFINLSTALAVRKSKEVGVRKTLGASRFQLLRQYLADTLVVTVISGLLSVGIAERLLPLFNNFFDKDLRLNIVQDGRVIVFVLVVVLIVTLLAGIYPALVLSGYKPVKALKNNIHSQSGSSLFLRKGLITLQFFISQVLIIGTIVIASQMKYFTNKPLGFDKEAIVTVEFEKNDKEILERFRDQLLADPAILDVSFALGAPMSGNRFETHFYLNSQGKDQQHDVLVKSADYHYKDTYGLTLKYGRWFTPGEEGMIRDLLDWEEDENGESIEIPYILNETAARNLGFHNPEDAIGKSITTGISDITAPIVGIVEDFHTNSLHEKVEPTLITHFPLFYYTAGIKLSTDRTSEAVDHIQQAYQNVFPENIFEYKFMDDSVREFYEAEQRTFNLFTIFSGISIFISCLGLLGMISFIANQRSKEVGIRKVLGAGVSQIMMLFSKDFMVLVVIAFVLAAPVAWYIMSAWLDSFAYKIDMNVWFFLVAVFFSAVITFITIGYQSFRSAIDNPINALKDE